MINENDCQNRREEIAALVLGELEQKAADELGRHIESCETCHSLYQKLTDEEETIRVAFQKIADKGEVLKKSLIEQLGEKEPAKTIRIHWSNIIKSPFTKIAAAALLVIFSWAAFFAMSGKVKDLKEQLELAQRDIALAPADDSATINFYLKEHQDIVARYASRNSAPERPVQMHINRDSILYYEMYDNQPAYMRPGIIVRGPSTQLQTGSPETTAISNGQSLTISEAREITDFELHAPARLFPGYSLDQIRKIENRDAMQLLYTNGINSISLFEQPLDGRRGLEPKDFREYAVFQNKGQAGGTVLAWRDDALSYVLIGNTEMSQLMNMAQSVSAGK